MTCGTGNQGNFETHVLAAQECVYALKRLTAGYPPKALDMWILEQFGPKKFQWGEDEALERCLQRTPSINRKEVLERAKTFRKEWKNACKKKDPLDIKVTNIGNTLTFGNSSHYVNRSILKKLHDSYKGEPSKFPHAAWALTHLYEMFLRVTGDGMQLSVPNKKYLKWAQKQNISLECFASPFNHNLPRFCSALPIVDAPFGSLGSFFDIDLKENAICNPPYTEEVLSAAFDRIEHALNNHPLLIIFVTPCWDDADAIIRAKACPYKIKEKVRRDFETNSIANGISIVHPCDSYVFTFTSK
ncbi:hypothetical protein H8356DRAFT_1618025 [Neocallimastix lanati (nom. inval.)]|jgi:hypothetical protein|nr:hypothetical protein H8356DRAFT_1618025 [Neocallimastix sp. JGI-2020a]